MKTTDFINMLKDISKEYPEAGELIDLIKENYGIKLPIVKSMEEVFCGIREFDNGLVIGYVSSKNQCKLVDLGILFEWDISSIMDVTKEEVIEVLNNQPKRSIKDNIRSFTKLDNSMLSFYKRKYNVSRKAEKS